MDSVAEHSAGSHSIMFPFDEVFGGASQKKLLEGSGS